jgi:capsular exopolysaccharide synthesis family protein
MDIDVRGYLLIILRRWWALAAGLVAGLALGYGVLSYLGTLPAYTATATILVIGTGSTSSSTQDDTLVLTFAELARQDTVTQAVIDTLGLAITAQEVALATKVNVIASTRLMEIAVTYRDPQTAAAIANEEARQLAGQAAVRAYRLQVVSPAIAPNRPDLGPYINVALAGALGLLLATGLVFLGEYLRDPVRGAAVLASRLGLPVLGTFTRQADKKAQAIWPLVEQCIRLGRAAGHRRLLVTSPGTGEGKSTVAALLATAWTRTGRSAVLVDANVRRPVLHQRLGCPNEAGLADWLSPSGVAVPTCPVSEHLALLPSGPPPADPVGVLVSQQWPAVLATLDAQADMVIIDGPPVLPAAELSLLAPQVDGILLVLRVGKTTFAALSEAVEALKLVDGPILGLVLNRR